jgi:putative thioredoxin
MFQGQLVADLTPARTEKQFAQYLDQLLKQLPIQGEAQQLEAEIEPLIEMGEGALAEGHSERAIGIFAQLHEMVPEEPAVISGLARALVGAGQVDEAAGLIEALPEETRKDPAITRAESAIALAREVQPVDDLTPLQRRVEADPADLEARYELAGGLMASGDRDGAADQLLAIIAADRAWNEGAARSRLLKLMEVVGVEDPWTSATRRRLSALLFT